MRIIGTNKCTYLVEFVIMCKDRQNVGARLYVRTVENVRPR